MIRSSLPFLVAICALAPRVAHAERLTGTVVLADTGVGLVDYQVQVYPVGDPGGGAIAGAVSGEDGSFELTAPGLPEGRYPVRVISPNGVAFGEWEGVQIPATGVELVLEPSGTVYEATTGEPVAGAFVWVHRLEGTDPCADPGSRLAREALGQGQQGQRTDLDGLYHLTTPCVWTRRGTATSSPP